MKLKALKIRQWSGSGSSTEIYVATMRAGDLIDRYMIDRWTPDNPDGYQRMPMERRLTGGRGSPVRYLLEELGSFPTSVLLSVRGDIQFDVEADMGWYQLGEVTLPDDVVLWLIDGQHRVEALKRACMKDPSFKDYPLIVSLLSAPDVFDEMLHFYIVNKRQASVPTDLAYRHLQRMLWKRGVQWLYNIEGPAGVRSAFAAVIVDYLYEEPDSPWYKRITRVGEEAKPEDIIRDAPLIKSISGILREKTFEGMNLKEVADSLINYWNALKSLYPEAFDNPRRFTLLGTPGIYSFHMLFPSVHARCMREGDLSVNKMQEILGKLQRETPTHPQDEFKRPITIDFWDKAHGPAIALSTSQKMIRELYRDLYMKLQLAESAT